MTKILLAGLLGGIAMFMWEGLAHEVLPLGEAGVSGLSNEAAIVSTVKDNVKQAGFYIFPGGDLLQPGLTGAQREEAMKKAAEQWKAGPAGIMVVHPEGLGGDAPVNLVTQALFDIGVTLVAAILLSFAPLSSFGARLAFVTAIGLVPTLNAELPYWNFYGFPTVFVMAQALIHLVGFAVAGVVLGMMVKSAAAKPAMAVRSSAA
jgi:hypothetical protein